MAEEQKTFESTHFIVDGKTVDANGKEVKVEKVQVDAEADVDDKPTPKAPAKK